MARRKDAEEDPRVVQILEQLNTKTVGPPNPSTGLVGDNAPEEVFKATDMDKIKDQVTLQLDNLEILNALTTVGQISNTLSLSGPIPNTMKMSSTGRVIATGTFDVFRPDPGQVWVCSGVQLDASAGSGAVTAVLHYEDDTGAEVRIESNSTAGTAEFNITSTAGPLYVTRDVYLRVTISSLTTGEECVVNGAFIRVR